MGSRKVKIQLYNKTRTKAEVLAKFGDYILDDICINCVVEENLETTEYFLDAEFFVDNEGLYKCIEEDAILKVLIDYGEEIFSIVDIKKTPTRIIVFARQITITESICSWMDDVRPEVKTGKDALNHMGANAIGPHNLEFDSDIDTINTAYYLNQTLYDALHISDNCFAVRWGGEMKRRGYRIIVNKKIGEDSGVQIRSGKNLIGFEASTNIDSIITRIKPIGFNGITTEGYIDSPLIDNYKYIRTQTMKYEHVKLASDIEEGKETDDGDLVYETLEEAQNKLTELALLEFLAGIDVLQAEYVVDFVDLSTTEEYKNYAQAELILLGDYVHVYEEKHNVNITVRAVSRKYNILAQKVQEIKLSNKTIGKQQAETIEQLKSRLDDVAETVDYMKVSYASIEDLDAAYAVIRQLDADKASVLDIEAVNGSINSLAVGKATIESLEATNLIVENLQANKVDISALDAINTEIAGLKENKTLWSGAYHMDAEQIISLSESISDQTAGIVLVFSQYDIAGNLELDQGFNYHFVPKIMVTLQSGKSSVFSMGTSNETLSANKCLYISNTTITGHSNNIATGTGSTGVTYNNNAFVLRYVIGV